MNKNNSANEWVLILFIIHWIAAKLTQNSISLAALARQQLYKLLNGCTQPPVVQKS